MAKSSLGLTKYRPYALRQVLQALHPNLQNLPVKTPQTSIFWQAQKPCVGQCIQQGADGQLCTKRKHHSSQISQPLRPPPLLPTAHTSSTFLWGFYILSLLYQPFRAACLILASGPGSVTTGSRVLAASASRRVGAFGSLLLTNNDSGFTAALQEVALAR